LTGASAEAPQVAQRSRRDASLPGGDGAAERRGRKAAKAAGTRPKDVTGQRGVRFARRAHNYGRTILWAVRDTFGSGRGKLALALLLGGMSLAAQALAVLVVFGYGQVIQQDGSLAIPLLGIEWAARTETAFLFTVVAAFAASLSAAAVLTSSPREFSSRLSGAASQGRLKGSLGPPCACPIRELPAEAACWPSWASVPAPRRPRAAPSWSFRRYPPFSARFSPPACFSGLIRVLTAVLILVTAAWSALLYPVSLRVVAFAAGAPGQ